MKRLLVVLLSLMMLCSVSLAEESSLKMSDEKVTFTVLQQLYSSQNIEQETNWAINWLEEQTNVKLDYEFVKSPDWQTKLNMTLVSEELPDIIWPAEGLDDEEYGVVQQIFLPLDDMIDQYMPNLKAFIEADPNSVLKCVASDGHIYGLPGYYDNAGIEMQGVFFINNTWLNKLELKVPTTVDELTEVLRAFKTQDPNGNGIADEIPYSCSFGGHVNNGIFSMFFFYGIPTDGTTFFSLDEEGVVTFDPYRPGFRECVEWLHLLYDEGLMEKEALTQDSNTFTSKINDGNYGFIPFWRLDSMNIDDVKDNYINIFPVSADGYQALMNRVASFAEPRIYLHNPDTAELICRYIDAQMPVDIQYTMDYGEKGIDWDIDENGTYYNITTTSDAPNKAKANFAIKFRSPQVYEHASINPANMVRKEYYNAFVEAGLMQKYPNNLLKCANLTADDAARVALSLVDIQTAVTEFVSQGIVDGVTDASWNAFMDSCAKMGVQDYLDTYNAVMPDLINR